MAPKKLTDCPENLREAIDWLIQVRHGGDKKGLEHLAKALKKLIDKAICEAESSLKYRESKLCCTGNASRDAATYPTVTPLCKAKDAEIEEAQKNLKTKKSTPYENTDDSKKEIDALEAEIKKAEASKNDCAKTHSLPEEERTKGLAEITQQKQIVQSLTEFTKTLENNDNSNMLNNLCSGLETFLGFDSASKGYTGKGIVYSDLDRLCDAVMAFFLRCLDECRDLLWHYHKPIDDVITNLKGLIGKGTGVSGFVSTIAKVKGVLQGYESGLSNKCRDVIDDIRAIKSTIDTYREQIILPEFSRKNLGNQLRDVSIRAMFFDKKADKAVETASQLDYKLKNYIDKAVNLVKKGAETLKSSCDDPQVNQWADKVDKGLPKEKEKIRKAVFMGLSNLQDKLDGEVTKIQTSLSNLKDVKLKDEMRKVRDSTSNAQQVSEDVIGKFEQEYKQNIDDAFTRLKKTIKDIDPKTPGKNISLLENEVNNITSAITNLEGAYETKLIEVRAAVDNAVDRAVAHLGAVDIAVKSGLKHVRTQIKIQLDGFLQQMWNAVDLGMVKAASSDIYSPTSGVTGLTTGFQSAGLSELETRFREVGQDHAELAKKIHTVLKNLHAVKNDKSATPSGDLLFELLGGEIKTAFENQLKKVIFDDIESIKLDELMAVYHKEAHTNSSETLKKKIEDIKLGFASGITNKDGEVSIDPETFEGYTDANEAYKEAVSKIHKKINDLEFLPGAIEEAQLAAGKRMEQLKSEIVIMQRKIDVIDEAIEEANHALQRSIKSVEDTASMYKNSTLQYMSALQINLIKNLDDAFATLTSQVQFLFAKQKQAELAALGNVVAAQLKEIERVIKEDRGSGLKGFLTRLKGDSDADGRNVSGEMLQAVKTAVGSAGDKSQELKKLPALAEKFRDYVDIILKYIEGQVQTQSKDPTQPAEKNPPSKHVQKIKGKLDKLLKYLLNNTDKKYNFDHRFSDYLHEVVDAVGALSADKFGDGVNAELLNVVKSSISAFDTQLMYAYINKFCGQTITWTESKDGKVVSTGKATNCAKAFMTIIPIIIRELNDLLDNTDENGNWYYWPISDAEQSNNPVGRFFKCTGYIVSSHHDVCNAELQNTETFRGEHVHILLTDSSNKLFKQNDDPYADVLKKLYFVLERYYEVSHLPTPQSPEVPCNIYQMLRWLCGLWYNPVREPFFKYIKELFEKPDDYKQTPYHNIPNKLLKLQAHPQTILYDDLEPAFRIVCHSSHRILTAILGHGHADGIYAVDFSNNSYNMHYPTDMITLLCILYDVIKRLYQQLHFLYQQCNYDDNLSGWLDCEYGRDVGGSSWRCNAKQYATQTCDHKGNTNCDRRTKCSTKSPLQSFLEDGLLGFLPHQLKFEKGKFECSLKSHSNVLCKTPMGFSEIGVLASHLKNGQYLRDALADFCGHPASPLSKLCGQIACLLPSAPQTLGDMFAFYYNFINAWGKHKNVTLNNNREIAFEATVKDANFKRSYTELNDCTELFKSRTHSSNHNRGELHSLLDPAGTCYTKHTSCGAYMDSLNSTIYNSFASKNSPLYLSWIVYVTEVFYKLLCDLRENCHANCGSESKKCVNGCIDNICKVKQYNRIESFQHSGLCNSILQCPHTLPTLYNSGLTFGNRRHLDGSVGDFIVPKRTCQDFIDQLNKVCSDRSVLAMLIHKTIPDFLWTIRTPFSYLVLALWLLSLLYLIHIMVIRLDLLHIKSHLHSPSSHRIAAQSLLAAARVKALNKVLYLQP